VLERWDPLILLHATTASFALLLGAVQLLRRRRGDRPHRYIGWSWVIAMAITLATSFGIRTINGGFGWLHALSLFTAFTLTMGVVAARQHRIKAHRSFMTGSYFGLLGAFAGVLAVPERRIPDTVVHHPLLVAVFVGAIIVTTAASVWGAIELGRAQTARASAGSLHR
jgi:uncharacterized membrane protein